MEYGFAYTVCRRAVFYYGNGPAWKLKFGSWQLGNFLKVFALDLVKLHQGQLSRSEVYQDCKTTIT